MTVVLYDTTLRDGMQGEGPQLSVGDKLAVARLLDELGIAYIEGGWPGSNPRDEEFFRQAKRERLSNARLAAFGSTRRPGVGCDDDPSIRALLRAEVGTVTVFGKSSVFQATEALGIDPEQNLELIADSVRYLKARVAEVVFDAEHFFDGFAEREEYALRAVEAAAMAGADYVVLCDTNGGSLPDDVARAVRSVEARVSAPVGIHTHNDAGLAVANSLAAVGAGARMVQGTINGYGERCGNANLVSIIPALVLKMGIACVPKERLRTLTRLAHTVDELSNQSPRTNQPYVGRSAFAHKGGVHVNAVMKNSRTYEHIDPEVVGNQRRILISDLSGRANVVAKLRDFGVNLDADSADMRRILERIKDLENQGYQFEGAEGSFKLLVDEALGRRQRYFILHGVHLSSDIAADGVAGSSSSATGRSVARIRLEVGGVLAETSAEGTGPVHAMDAGLRKLIDKFYPTLKTVKLVDYKVRVLSSGEGTGSVVRVLIQSSDGEEVWGTLGVSSNIIDASWQAMVDGLEYKLAKDGVPPHV